MRMSLTWAVSFLALASGRGSCDELGDESVLLQLRADTGGVAVSGAGTVIQTSVADVDGKKITVEMVKGGVPIEQLAFHPSNEWASLTAEEAALDPTGILPLGAPETCGGCELEKWDQYAICREALREGQAVKAAALSFGVMGYDPWGMHLQQNFGFLPRLYDCFDLRRPANFEHVFEPVCLGPVAGEQATGHGSKLFETLPRQLDLHAGGKPAIVKIDIEDSEYSVLEALSDTELDRLSSIHVEYHFNSGGNCPDERQLNRWKANIKRMRQRFAVIDAWVNYYDFPDKCLVGGREWPRLFTVSYAPRSACGPAIRAAEA